MKEQRVEFLSNIIDGLYDEIRLSIINEYITRVCADNPIYENVQEGLEQMTEGMFIDEVFRAIAYGRYDFLDKYVTIDAYGNVVSMNQISVDVKEVAEWMIDDDGNAEDAWTILNASLFVEQGLFVEDLADIFYNEWDAEWEQINDYLEYKDRNCSSVKHWVTESWNGIYEDFKKWINVDNSNNNE